MSSETPRIFISYRGESAGASATREFGERLYNHMTDDPMCEEKYGEIFFSPRSSGASANYQIDIPTTMQNVKFFIMPLNDAYFGDFWDEKNERPDEGSTTYKEIKAAMDVGSRFICIAMPGYEVDRALNTKLFGDRADIISCSIMQEYDPDKETELFRRIEDEMVKPEYYKKNVSEVIRQNDPNVFLSFKGDLEAPDRYPFYRKLADVRKMTLVNFAASVFIAGIQIASMYEQSDGLKRWFSFNLVNGNIEVDIILTDPHSAAARDAALFKMYPDGQKTDSEKIILTNINLLYSFMENNPNAKVNLYLTDIALPYGLMITEHNNPANNHMKVDLYASVTNNDHMRPSFYLMENDPATSKLYGFFKENAQNILRDYSYAYRNHPDCSWLTDEPIIHRAVLKKGLFPHAKRSVEACVEAGCPIEVDLLELPDRTIIAGRADQDISSFGVNKSLADCTAVDIRKINQKAGEDKILLLRDLLQLVKGQVPILFEIKAKEKGELSEETKNMVNSFMNKLERYLDRYVPVHEKTGDHSCHVAVHSSNPYVLKLVRQIDAMIPCGIVSMDYSGIEDKVGTDFVRMHREAGYLDVFSPDFISYDVRDLDNGPGRSVSRSRRIPLLAWTIRDEDDQQKAVDYDCDNIIIEGARTYL